jgi:3-hydroxy-3-methylglutaryl CoA synthase
LYDKTTTGGYVIGITSFGAYIPRLRLQREAIARANTWFDPSLKALAKGERSMCNWDEDSITMAVAAARDATDAGSRSKVRALFLAPTSLPFLDRQNAAIVSEALNLGGNLRSMDVSGSQRAATSALLSALDAVEAGCPAALLIGSEHRRSRVGTAMEMLSGDAAAALLIAASNDSIIARFIDSHSITCDFVDHYRTEESEFDYDWEERWIRDEGYMKQVPETVTA